MSDYRNIFSNDGERYDQPNQPKKRSYNNPGESLLTSDEINSGRINSAPKPTHKPISKPTPVQQSDDDFVIGGGFKISGDYESRIRSRKEKARAYIGTWRSYGQTFKAKCQRKTQKEKARPPIYFALGVWYNRCFTFCSMDAPFGCKRFAWPYR